MKDQNICISVYPNACGFLWSASMVDSGTDLGYSEYNGNCVESGSFLTYEDAWEDALVITEGCTLERFKKIKSHWCDYANYARKVSKE